MKEITNKNKKIVIEGKFTIINELGLHARAATKLVQRASKYKSEILLEKDGKVADGKSILGLLSLIGIKGSVITLKVIGEDAEEAFNDIAELIKSGFGEL